MGNGERGEGGRKTRVRLYGIYRRALLAFGFEFCVLDQYRKTFVRMTCNWDRNIEQREMRQWRQQEEERCISVRRHANIQHHAREASDEQYEDLLYNDLPPRYHGVANRVRRRAEAEERSEIEHEKEVIRDCVRDMRGMTDSESHHYLRHWKPNEKQRVLAAYQEQKETDEWVDSIQYQGTPAPPRYVEKEPICVMGNGEPIYCTIL
jgi:hypothetical protein